MHHISIKFSSSFLPKIQLSKIENPFLILILHKTVRCYKELVSDKQEKEGGTRA